MSLSVIATLADIIAALGIIASLIFVALQVKQNTRETKNTNFQASQERVASLQSRTMDERVAAIIQQGKKSYAQLEEAEKLVFSSWVLEYQLVADNYISLGRQGILESELAKMFQRRLENLFRNPGVQELYRDKDLEPLPDHIVQLAEKIFASS